MASATEYVNTHMSLDTEEADAKALDEAAKKLANHRWLDHVYHQVEVTSTYFESIVAACPNLTRENKARLLTPVQQIKLKTT